MRMGVECSKVQPKFNLALECSKVGSMVKNGFNANACTNDSANAYEERRISLLWENEAPIEKTFPWLTSTNIRSDSATPNGETLCTRGRKALLAWFVAPNLK